MNKKVCVMLVVIVASMTIASVAPALAKSYKVPEGVIMYYCSQGIAYIDDTPLGTLKITAFDVVDSPFGPGDFIHIDASSPWGVIPAVIIGTNDDLMNFFADVWVGTPAGFNIFTVEEGDLQVDRHGNRITASLITPQTYMSLYTGPPPVQTVLPAFTMELNKVDGSFHAQADYTGLYYTIDWDRMGFNADGAFTCPDPEWDFDAEPMYDCRIVMHGITTYTPVPD